MPMDKMGALRTSLLPMLVWALQSLAAPAQAATEEVVWAVTDFPPISILNGPLAGRGFTDKARKLFIDGLPEYSHRLMEANYPRVQLELRSKDNVCSPAILRLPERDSYTVFSEPYLVAVPYQAVILDQRAALQPYLNAKGQLRLEALLEDGVLRVGIAGGRALGPKFEQMVKMAPAGSALVVRRGGADVAGVLRMLMDKKVDLVVGFPTEANFAAQTLNLAPDAMKLYPVAGGDEGTWLRVGCSKSSLGERVVQRVNDIIKAQRTQFDDYYLEWLPPSLLPIYRKLNSASPATAH